MGKVMEISFVNEIYFMVTFKSCFFKCFKFKHVEWLI